MTRLNDAYQPQLLLLRLLAFGTQHIAGCQLLPVQDNQLLGQFHELADSRVTRPVVHELPTPLTTHKATVAQTLQMHRDTPLRRTRDRDQLADIALTLQEQDQNLQAGRLAHPGEDAGEQFNIMCSAQWDAGSGLRSDQLHSNTPIIFWYANMITLTRELVKPMYLTPVCDSEN